MSELIKVKINGKEYEAENGEYIMELARRNKILIPSFCRHESLTGLGCCRLCIVEVKEDGEPKVVVSCVYPVTRTCEVYTETDKIKAMRRTVLSMLKELAPEGKRIASLCKMYGVQEESRYAGPGAESVSANRMNAACILCGLCVEACSKLGAGAISAVGRGIVKKISTPYNEASPDCMGCGSCAEVCPTGAIECDESENARIIWGKTFVLVRCEKCGRPFATKEELEVSAGRYASQSNDVKLASSPKECENCRRRKSSDVMAKVFGI